MPNAIAPVEVIPPRELGPASRMEASKLRRQRREALNEALAADRTAAERLAVLRNERDAADRAYAAVPGSNWITAVGVGAAGGVCYLAEFQITWDSLPFLLNVPKHSFGGVALGLTVPIIATTILHLAIERLFESPWRERTSPTRSRWQRAAATLAMGALMVTLGTVTLYTIGQVGFDRNNALHAQQTLERLLDGTGNGDIAVPEVPVVRSFIALGILLAIAGAVAFGVAATEVRHAALGAWLALRRTWLRFVVLRASHHKNRTAAALTTEQYAWDTVEDDARAAAEIHDRASRASRRSNLEIVDELFANRRRGVAQQAESS